MTNYSQTETAKCGVVALAHALKTNDPLECIREKIEFLLHRNLDKKFLDPETMRTVISGITIWEMSFLLAEFGIMHHVFDQQAYGARSLIGYNFDKLSGTRYQTHIFEDRKPAILGVYRVDELYNILGHWVYVEDGKIFDGLKDSPFVDWDGIHVVMGCLIHKE